MRIAFYIAFNEKSVYQKSLPPLGIGYLISYIKKYYPKYELFFCYTVDEILSAEPHIVCISSATENFPEAVSSACRIKDSIEIPIIIGGIHITSLPHKLPKCFDIGILGEGEITLSELLGVFKSNKFAAEDLEKIKGLCFHKNNTVIITTQREQIDNLDILPYPDRELLGSKWVIPPRDEVHLITSRGCPYDCSFCAASLVWKKYRYFSVDYVAAEVEALIKKYHPEEIYFFDDLFIGNLKRFKQICDEFRKKGFQYKTVFRSYARVDLVNDELCKLFDEMNFRYIDLGIEANNETALDYYNKKNVTPEKNQKALECLVRNNISPGVNIIIGAPPETTSDIEETYQFVYRNRDIIDRISYGPLLALPGTKVWEYAAKKGIVNEDMDWTRLIYDVDNFDIENYPLLSEHLTRDELLAFQNKFYPLSKEITKMGYLKFLDAKVKFRKDRILELENELAELKGSRAIRIANTLRNLRKSLLG